MSAALHPKFGFVARAGATLHDLYPCKPFVPVAPTLVCIKYYFVLVLILCCLSMQGFGGALRESGHSE